MTVPPIYLLASVNQRFDLFQSIVFDYIYRLRMKVFLIQI